MALRNEVDELKKELLICKGEVSEWGALKTFLEGIRPGAMLRREKRYAQRLSKAIAIARKLTELAEDKPNSDVLSSPMLKDIGNSGGDREKPLGKNGKAKSGVKKKGRKENLKCYFYDGPHLIRGCLEKCRLTAIMKRMEEGEVVGIGAVASVKATKPKKRLSPIDGINTAKQGSKRGRLLMLKQPNPEECPRLRTAGVKAVEHKKGIGAITRDKVVKPRVQSEQVYSQYARIEAWSKLRHLRHKGTLKEYVSRFRKLILKVLSLTEEDGFFTFMFRLKPWAKRVLERREVNELYKALTTVESIKEFGVKKNKTSKEKTKVEGSGKRFRDEGKSEDDECCSLSGRENPLNDEPDGEFREDVCSLGTSSSVKDVKTRVRVEKMRGFRLKMLEVLQNYPSEDESSKVMDEPKIELSREEDEPRIEKALRVGSIRFIFAKASRRRVQEELFVSKEFPEHVRVENMALETILREGSKQGLAEGCSTADAADEKSNLWHQRLGHMSEKGIKTLLSKGKLSDLKNINVRLCEDCIFGKQKKVSFTKIGKTPKAKKLELVHIDVWGPSLVPSLANSLYYVTFIDDSARKNGVAERMNRTLNECARSMRIHPSLPKLLWAEAINTSAYLINRGPSVPLDGGIPEEVWSKKEINLSYLRVFDCISYIHINSAERSKLDAKSNKCVFVGYGGDEFESSSSNTEAETKEFVEFEEISGNDVQISPEAVQEEPGTPELRRSSRIPKPTQFKWESSMKDEMDSLMSNQTWKLTELPLGKKALHNKWIYRIKEEHDGSKRYKERLVVKGFRQKKDVKITFLHGDLEEEIYIRQPEGFIEADKKNLAEYINKVLSKFNMQDVKPLSTPLGVHFRLSKEQPDIARAVGAIVVKYQKEVHRYSSVKSSFGKRMDKRRCSCLCRCYLKKNVDGVNYFHVKVVGLFFVAATRVNASPSLVLELLQRIGRVIKDYLGVLSEDSFRLAHHGLSQEDFGYVQITSTEVLKSYIFNEPIVVDAARLQPLGPAAVFMQGNKRMPGTAITKSFVANEPGDRVSRQFDFHQPIPPIPWDHYPLHRLDGQDKHSVNWVAKHTNYINAWNYRASYFPPLDLIQDDDFNFETSAYLHYYWDHKKSYMTTLGERQQFKKYKKIVGKADKILPSGSSSQQHEAGTTQSFDDYSVPAYIPKLMHPQAPIYSPMFESTYDFEQMTSMISNTNICQSTFPVGMGEHSGGHIFATSDHMPLMNEDDDYYPEQPQSPQYIRRPPQHYHSTTPQHRK
ncbi:Pathoproteinsis-related thaumatin superfamily protein [Hibiscus syriacus]|uniref:Pathoproteinsis-related thaumatin superfamily protein n=1 Tax=Hibiscus syriacus TaxID=106335 RepID=A0A6A2ZVE9_HIBSY|nr:Pathoproteinsis-related thaumatin superfamily protein [Hibiscus syriacus]